MEVLWKTKIQSPYDPAVPLLGIYLDKTLIKKDTCKPYVHNSIIQNSQDMITILMSIDRWTDKEDVVHIYNGIPLSHKKEWHGAICSNMDATRDYRTKWSQKDKYHDITYMWNLKYDTNEPTYETETESCAQRTDERLSGGKGLGEGWVGGWG